MVIQVQVTPSVLTKRIAQRDAGAREHFAQEYPRWLKEHTAFIQEHTPSLVIRNTTPRNVSFLLKRLDGLLKD